MRLTAIKLAGFKSFVDSALLPLPSNLVAIVGPNGSGKSNLIDAVRWTLGESSSKTLRGVDADDIIFGGAGGRRQSGRASVELLFDNSDRSFQGPFGVYSEVSLRREAVRGEGSQYFLNGQKCLRRDVVNLFLGTGLGGRSQYAILEQGSIARVVDAKPDEMRAWLEEVAGISRYRERRRECELRIRGTRDNLARLNDLQLEIDHRLQALEKQADAANRYMEFRGNERRIRAEILILRRCSFDGQLDRKEKDLNDLQGRLTSAREILAKAEERHLRCIESQRDALERLGLQQGELYQAEALLSKREQALAHSRELRDLKERELRQVISQIEDAGAEQARLLEAAGSLASAGAEIRQRVDQALEQEQTLGQDLESAEAQLEFVQAEWDDFGHQTQEPLLQAEGERGRLTAARSTIEQIDNRIQRLRRERSGLDLVPPQSKLEGMVAELGTLERELEGIQVELKTIESELQRVKAQYLTAETALHKLRNDLESIHGRRASLETLQQAALRHDSGIVSEWLEKHGWGEQTQLAMAVQVEPGWEAAVEHVLGGLLHAPLLISWDAAQLPEGGPSEGAVLAAADSGEGHTPDGSLAGVVMGPLFIREWLNCVYRLDDKGELEDRLVKLEPGESLITADAVWHGRGWVRYPRMDAEHSGVLIRRQILKELSEHDKRLNDQVNSAERDLKLLHDRINVLERNRREAVTRQEGTRARHSRLLAQHQAERVRVEQLEERIKLLDLDIHALQTELKQEVDESRRVEERLKELEGISEQLHAKRNLLQQSLAAARERVQQSRAALLAASQQRSQAQIHEAANESAASSVRATLAELTRRLQQLTDEREKRLADTSRVQVPSSSHEEQVEQAKLTVDEERAKLLQWRENVAAAEVSVAEAKRSLQNGGAERDMLVEQLQQARLEFEAIRSRRQALSDQLEETQLDVGTLEATLDGSASLEVWENKLEYIERETARLGPINLAAVGELEENRQRASYMAGQRLDLDQALEELETVMRKLDKETQDLFQDTFGRINKLFGERCSRLFGGGEAWLEMTGGNWMTSGIRVMVRPPGKRNSTIQSLSGGEKAIAALALLFALFDLNPAPFCLLDEVEAPLDDPNVHRFIELIRDMSERVQFIIITHNKITMEAAEHLHGVTMKEPGVSRLVSVDMRQAARFIDSSPEIAEA